MRSLLLSYSYALLHPFEVNKLYKKMRLFGQTQMRLGGFTLKRLELTESLSISWLIFIFRSIFNILALHLLALFIEYSDFSIFSDSLPGINRSLFGNRIFFLALAFEVIFFPVITWIYVEFWRIFIGFMGALFEKSEANLEAVCEEILVVSLSSNLLRLIPLVGEFSFGVSRVLALFAGLRVNLGFSLSQAIICLTAPFLVMGALLFCSFFSLALFVSQILSMSLV